MGTGSGQCTHVFRVQDAIFEAAAVPPDECGDLMSDSVLQGHDENADVYAADEQCVFVLFFNCLAELLLFFVMRQV